MKRHLPLLLLAALAACSDDDRARPGGGGGSGGEGGQGGSGPELPALGCPVELDRGPESEARAIARRIEDPADLVGGEAAQGIVGDFLLANERLRAVVQGSDRTIGVNPYGGNLIDIDVVRGEGEPGRDVLGEIAPFYNLGRTPDPEREEDVFVLHDGSDGRAAVIAVNGRDTVNDYVAVTRMITALLGGATLALDSEKPVPAAITSYFLLEPGARHVRQITAFCNEGEEPLVLGVGDLVDSGGNVEPFNPHLRQGWGAASLPTDAPFLAWIGAHGGYALVPGDGGQKNQSLSTSGVTGTLQGSTSLFDWVGGVNPANPPAGALRVPAGGMASYERQIVPGRSLAEITEVIDGLRGTPVGTVRGSVRAGERPAAGARIAAVDEEGKTRTVFVAHEEGRYEGTLAAGAWELVASLPGQISEPIAAVVLPGEAWPAPEIVLGATGTLTVRASNALDGTPVAARVHVLCAGPCPVEREAEARFRDVDADPLPAGVFAIRHAGPDGAVSFELPAGAWEVLVSRGAEWDTFPADFPDTGDGHAVSVAAGGTAVVEATVSRVIDTTGWVSADFHVHAINSPDSPVPNRERVVSFLAENVEVLVQSDHEFVTDLAPEVEALGATSLIRTVVGTEMTTFDFGHVNAFPLRVDPTQRNGGAIDWAGGRGATLTPAQIFAAGRDRGAEVLQLNHARAGGSMGHFDALLLDTATLATHADPVSFRMEPNGHDPAVDSKLFSTEFTALEIFNGFDDRTFRALFNDWLTFLGRGLVVTGTAVSDTHKLASAGPGAPRSWVRLGSDDPAAVDPSTLAAVVNAGRVVGGTAPFVTVEAVSGEATAGVGETIASGGGEVELRVVVQSPRWARFNRVEVYSWRQGSEAVGGKWNASLPASAVAIQSDGTPARRVVDPADPSIVVDGFEGGQAIRVEESFRFQPEADTFYVVLVRTLTRRSEGLGEGEVAPPSLDPIAYDEDGGARAMAFANPIFVDVDGGGYDKPPLLQALEQGLVR